MSPIWPIILKNGDNSLEAFLNRVAEVIVSLWSSFPNKALLRFELIRQ